MMNLKLIYIFSLCHFIAVLYAHGQVRFLSRDNTYTFLVSPNYSRESKQIEDGDLDVLIVNDDQSNFKYALTVVKVFTDNIYTDLLKPDYKEAYLENCSCEILETKESRYSNFKGLVFTLKKLESGQMLRGYSVNVIQGGNLFNIVFMTNELSFYKYQEEFDVLLDSFKIEES